ncbi:hypothetical protein ABPG72_017415 [Tetrahymena utriculariae]
MNPSMISPPSNYFLSNSTQQAQMLPHNQYSYMVYPSQQTVQTLPIQNQIQLNQSMQTQPLVPQVVQQPMNPLNSQNSGCAVLCFPTFVNVQGYQGVPFYTVQNYQIAAQNGVIQMQNNPQISQKKFIQNQSQTSLNQQTQCNLSYNQNSSPLQTNEQKSQLFQTDAVLPSNQQQANYSTNKFDEKESSKATSLMKISESQGLGIKSTISNKSNQNSSKKDQTQSESNQQCQIQQVKEENTSFKLIKNHSVSTTININTQNTINNVASCFSENDNEELSSNNQNNYLNSQANFITKSDQGETTTAISLPYPTQSQNIKSKQSNTPQDQPSKSLKKQKQRKTKLSLYQSEIFESNQKVNQSDVKENIDSEFVNNQQFNNSQAFPTCKQENFLKNPDEKYYDFLSSDIKGNEMSEEEISINEQSQQKSQETSQQQVQPKSKAKNDQSIQQTLQNKLIKERLLENATSAQKELLSQIQQISKQNSAKAFLKAYKKFALQDHEYIYNYQINENQYYYKVCREMPIIRIDNPTKKDLEGFYRKFKKFFNGKQYNNNTLKIVLRNKLYGKLFNDFLELHSDKWLEESKSKNKDDLRIIIKFLSICHQNLDYLVFLRDHDKSKDKSNCAYDSD